MQQRFRAPEPGGQPAAPALLHLQCDVPAELQPVIARWWEEFHFAELLRLSGFLSARRGQLIAPDGHAPVAVMYGIANPAAADQPRPSELTLMPPELDGKVTFNRRILERTSVPEAADEPAGAAFLQLLRPVPDGAHHPQEEPEQIRLWPGVLSVSCWRSINTTPHTNRQEVVQLSDTELILAELRDDRKALQLLAKAADALPGWDASAYRQAFPTRGVLLPMRD